MFRLGISSVFVIARVKSGSHVGFNHTQYAREIYDTTMRLYEVLKKEFSKLCVTFDEDSQETYSPDGFREAITFMQ